MVRLFIGSIAGGIAQFIVGFLFWGTPFSRIALKSIDDAGTAQLQAALALALSPSGTGTYAIPSPMSGAGTVLYGKGPIATIHFNSGGFAAMDASSLLAGLILSIVTAGLIGVALRSLSDRLTSFADQLRVVILFAVAATLYLELGQPIFNHFGWTYFIYAFVCDTAGLISAGAVIAKWFLPKAGTTQTLH